MPESSAHPTNDKMIAIIQRTKIDPSYTYRSEALLEEKTRFLAAHCQAVLDVGKSSRERFALFKQGQVVTLDINQFEDYPDIVDDLCDIQKVAPESFDGIVCCAVLEHVYDPITAAANLHKMLKPGGFCLAYVPFLYRYHGRKNLIVQDYFRYTRDGIAYLFRHFPDVTLYPIRGRYSTMLNLIGAWKSKVEMSQGAGLDQWVDRIGSWIHKPKVPELQASGYIIWAIKEGGQQ